MERTVVLSFLNGLSYAFCLLLILALENAAVPSPSTEATQTIQPEPGIIAQSSSIAAVALGVTSTTSSSSSTATELQNINPASTESPEKNDGSSSVVNNENVTETEIVITESRHGKSLHHHPPNQQGIITNNDTEHSNTTTTENSASSPSEFSAKLATDGDHAIQRLEEGGKDAGADPSGKKQQLQEPRLIYVPTTAVVLTERDRNIQRIFGGECTFAHWNRCSRIDYWGGDYLVPDKHNPGKSIVRNHKIRCLERPKSTICLKNGWTVARCHMLCMSQCNLEYRMNYEKLVLHDGDCKLPLLLK